MGMREVEEKRRELLLGLWAAIGAGQLALVFHCVRLVAGGGSFTAGLATYGTGALLSLGALALGMLPGFFLGVPQSTTGTDDTAASQPRSAAYRPSVRVEVIADWLIKIAVGVGLMELRELPEALRRLGAWLGPAFGPEPSGSIIVIGLVLAHLILGFFISFIISFIDGPSIFRQALRDLADAAARILESALEPQPDGSPGKLPANVEPQAQQLRSAGLESLRTNDEKLAWVRVAISDRRYLEALDAIQAITSATPEVATKKAKMEVLATEGEVYEALYAPAPDGFRTAIRRGEALLASGHDTINLRGYLTCAYGQEHAWAKREEDATLMAEARAKVLEHAARPGKDGTWRRILSRALLPDERDNDLASLADDEQVRAVIGAKV